MVGYQDPKMGNNRRQALAQYLKGQSQSRASAANKLRGINTSALRAGAGNPFRRGGGKASPEKFAFAGMKPSLKTLLGLVGKTMGQGGALSPFSIYGQDTPVGGLEWGGQIDPNPPGTPSMGGSPAGFGLPDGASPTAGPGYQDVGFNPFAANQATYPQNPFGIINPGYMPFDGYQPWGGGYTSPQKPILGDLLYGGF